MIAIFLDIETTGLDPLQHSPIDLAFKVLNLGTGEVLGSYQSLVLQPREAWEKSDPASMEINGYTWEEICTGKDPEIIKNEVITLLNQVGVVRGKAVFICQNPAFDRAFFTQMIPVYDQEKMNWPYHWLDLASMYWEKLMLQTHEVPQEINLSKNSIAEKYHIPPEDQPHKAINGVDHLITCYQAVTQANWPNFSATKAG